MSEQLFQIGIKAIIRNEQGQILLVGFHFHGNPELDWDLPGGRMDEGEDFMQALGRELQEEVGIAHSGDPKLFAAGLTSIQIPVGDKRVPLVRIAYEVQIADDAAAHAVEEGSIIEWVTPQVAAERLSKDFPTDFCARIAKL